MVDSVVGRDAVVEQSDSGVTPSVVVTPFDGGELSPDPVLLLLGLDDPAGVDSRFLPLEYANRRSFSAGGRIDVSFGELDAVGVDDVFGGPEGEEEGFIVRGEAENPVMIPFYGLSLCRLCGVGELSVERARDEGRGGGGRPSEDPMRLSGGVGKRPRMQGRRPGRASSGEREEQSQERENVHPSGVRRRSEHSNFRQDRSQSGIIVATELHYSPAYTPPCPC